MKNLTEQDIQDVLQIATEVYSQNRHLRLGQCFFNELYRNYPHLAQEIRGTKSDPFYIDERIDECIVHLRRYIK